jgi:hypothetical protein
LLKASNGSITSSRPELELLLCCARKSIDAARSKRISELVQEQIDWPYLMRTAFAHGVMPLLFKNLSAICWDQVPAAVGAQVRNSFEANVQRNLLLTAELVRLLRLFEDQGISALPYKGPVLAASVYGDVSLRSYTDLDILVHKDEILKAKDLVVSQGYRLRTPLTENQEAAQLRSRNRKDFALIGPRDVIRLELHWELASLSLFPLETRRLWDRLERFQICGMKVLNLPAEDLLLTLCVHGAKHFFKRLEWICDIAELIGANQGMKWERVLEDATKLRTKRMLLLGLVLARDMLGADLPDELQKNIQADDETRGLAGKVSRSIFSENDSNSETIERDVHVICLRERMWDRMVLRFYYAVDYFRALITPNEEDRHRFRLPGRLWFLYYFLRPLRLLKVYGGALLARKMKQRQL